MAICELIDLASCRSKKCGEKKSCIYIYYAQISCWFCVFYDAEKPTECAIVLSAFIDQHFWQSIPYSFANWVCLNVRTRTRKTRDDKNRSVGHVSNEWAMYIIYNTFLPHQSQISSRVWNSMNLEQATARSKRPQSAHAFQEFSAFSGLETIRAFNNPGQ